MAIELTTRARWTYELGQFRAALPAAAAVVALTAAVAVVGKRPERAWVLGALLLGLVLGAAAWRRSAIRALVPGLVASLFPLALPGLMFRITVACGMHSIPLCLTTCAVAGWLASVVIVWTAARVEAQRRVFLVVAGATASLAGAMVCTEFGLLGLTLLGAGVAAGAVPDWLRSRPTEN
jgi:hypothetical protein